MVHNTIYFSLESEWDNFKCTCASVHMSPYYYIWSP